MHSYRQVCWSVLEHFVVHLNIHIQYGFRVYAFLPHSGEYRLGAEKRESGIIELDIATPEVVQLDDFFAICLDQVREILRFDTVYQDQSPSEH